MLMFFPEMYNRIDYHKNTRISIRIYNRTYYHKKININKKMYVKII